MERRNLNLYQDFRAGVNAFVRSAGKFELSAAMTSKRGAGVVGASDRQKGQTTSDDSGGKSVNEKCIIRM